MKITVQILEYSTYDSCCCKKSSFVKTFWQDAEIFWETFKKLFLVLSSIIQSSVIVKIPCRTYKEQKTKFMNENGFILKIFLIWNLYFFYRQKIYLKEFVDGKYDQK